MAERRDHIRSERANILNGVGVSRVKIIRDYHSDWIKYKWADYIGLGCIRANRLDWSNMIIPNRADQMRAIIAEKRICHCGNVLKVDNGWGGKKGRYFDYKYIGEGLEISNGYFRYIKDWKRDMEMVIQGI